MIDRIRKTLYRSGVASSPPHLELGEHGERVALAYLEDQGYRIVATNFRLPLGRGLHGQKLNAEIDVIAYEDNTVVFIEVKTRTSDEVATPERAVNLRKQRQIARAARRYRTLMKVMNEPYRYDVVTILSGSGRPRINLLRGYFDETVFHRSRYFAREFDL